jgi:hypothetical protein
VPVLSEAPDNIEGHCLFVRISFSTREGAMRVLEEARRVIAYMKTEEASQ